MNAFDVGYLFEFVAEFPYILHSNLTFKEFPYNLHQNITFKRGSQF